MFLYQILFISNRCLIERNEFIIGKLIVKISEIMVDTPLSVQHCVLGITPWSHVCIFYIRIILLLLLCFVIFYGSISQHPGDLYNMSKTGNAALMGSRLCCGINYYRWMSRNVSLYYIYHCDDLQRVFHRALMGSR